MVLLTTEFYYIEVGEGIARIYHFLTILITISLIRFVPKLFRARVFWALIGFVIVSFLASALSHSPQRAMASFLSLGANASVAIATALILFSERVNLRMLRRIVLVVCLVGIFWGLFQIIAFKVSGIVLALSAEQEAQILIGFGPGFRTEANSFAKYTTFCFLLFLPEYIENRRNKYFHFVYIIFTVGIFMNFTRSSIYGLWLASIFIIFSYVLRNRFGLFAKRSMKIFAAASVVMVLIGVGMLDISEYGKFKIMNIFVPTEIISGDSSSYRLLSMRIVVEDAFSSVEKLIIGNGWGQTHTYFRGIAVQEGGGDIISILGYTGLIGVAAYLLLIFVSFSAARRATRLSLNMDTTLSSRGIMFTLLGVFCIAQMSGFLITPEFWLLIGICIYLSSGGHKIGVPKAYA